MKRLFSIFLALIPVLTISAQLNGDGYYRVQNAKSERYVYVTDGYSSGIDASSTTVDMGAIQLWKGKEKTLTDPASIIYIKQYGSLWDLMGQGTSVHSLINYYVKIAETVAGSNYYQVSATASGQTLYLYDGETSDKDRGKCATGSVSGTTIPAAYNRWHIFGMNQDDNYIAVSPGVSSAGKYYAPYYVSFPFSFYSSGMKAYYVEKIDNTNKLAVIKELTGIVPSSTPVIIECSSNTPVDNKLKLEAYESYPNCPSDDVMKGVYFSNQYRVSDVSCLVYDSKTMRVLGTTSTGKLGFVTATNDMLHDCGIVGSPKWCLPANQSYLPVEEGAPSEFTIVTEAEYEVLSNVKVSSVTLDKTSVTSHIGETVQLQATVLPDNAKNKTLTWKSSNESVATVNNGVVTMKNIGSATITATTTDGTNITAACTVTVEPVLAQTITLDKTSVELEIGQSAILNYTITPDNVASTDVTWSTSDAGVVTVDNGTITAVGIGSAYISVQTTDGSNLSATCKVTVTPILAQNITLDKTSVELEIGQSENINYTISPADATIKDVVWSTSDAGIATVDNGTITAVGAGTAEITVKTIDGSNLSATCEVTVNPIYVTGINLDKTELTLNQNETAQLTVTVVPDDATTKVVKWESSDETIVTVSEAGLVKAINAGQASVTACTTDGSNLSAACAITVIEVDGIASISINSCPNDCTYYTISGQMIPVPRKGVLIVRYPDGQFAKVLIK